jgi:hypothetical protein
LHAVVPDPRVVPALRTLRRIEPAPSAVVTVVALVATVPRYEPQWRAVVSAPGVIPAAYHNEPAVTAVIPAVPHVAFVATDLHSESRLHAA